MTPLKLGEFFLAYFVGALKVTFLDAYRLDAHVGRARHRRRRRRRRCATAGTRRRRSPPPLRHPRCSLTRPPLSPEPQGVVVVETLFIVIVSVLITQFATGLFAEMMAAEGFEVAAAEEAASEDAAEEAASEDAAAAGASEEGGEGRTS